MEYTKQIAIFYPCSYEEYDDGKLQDSLERMEKSRPSSKYSFDIFFITVKKDRRYYSSLYKYEKYDFINKVYIHCLHLNKFEDIYIQPWENKYVPQIMPMHGLSSGPNLSFYRGLYYMIDHRARYKNFLLMETDVAFLKQGWLDRFVNYAENNDFEIAGSKYNGINPDHLFGDYKDHLNGVALYKNTSKLLRLLKHSEEHLIQHVADGGTFINFDIAINNIQKNGAGYNLVDTDFITNINCSITDSELTKEQALEQYPNTDLLHHKSPLIEPVTY